MLQWGKQAHSISLAGHEIGVRFRIVHRVLRCKSFAGAPADSAGPTMRPEVQELIKNDGEPEIEKQIVGAVVALHEKYIRTTPV